MQNKDEDNSLHLLRKQKLKQSFAFIIYKNNKANRINYSLEIVYYFVISLAPNELKFFISYTITLTTISMYRGIE